MNRFLAGCSALVFAVSIIASADAAPILLEATDAGFVTSAGGSAKGDGTLVPPATYNYSVGWEVHYVDGSLGMPPGSTPLAAMERKNYFVFDLTGITTPITSAAFLVNAGTYESSDPTETLSLHAPIDVGAALGESGFLLSEHAVGPTAFDEPSDPAVLTAMGLYGGVTGGPSIGSASVSAADDDMELVIPIDTGFLNAHLGSLVIFGGELSTLTAAGTPEAIMGFTGPDIPSGDPLTPKLIVETIPTPGALGGGLILLTGLGLLRRWRGQ